MTVKSQTSCRVRWSAVAAAVLCWGGAGAWAADAGWVQFVSGDVRLERGGASQAVARGSAVQAGDVLRSAGGQAQIRFSDGGLVALYPQSHITIGAYSDSAQTGQSEDRFSLRFLQGALRAVTGKIGQRSPQNYQVITPTAVVGVRGTAFKMVMNEQGEVEITGEHNTIDVCTQAGCVEVKPREAVRVPSAQEWPVYTHTRALLPQPLPRSPVAGEELLPDGSYGAVVLQRDPGGTTNPGGGTTTPGGGTTNPGGGTTTPGGGTTTPGGGTTTPGGGTTTPGGGTTNPGGGTTTPGGGTTTPGGGTTNPGGGTTNPGGRPPGTTTPTTPIRPTVPTVPVRPIRPVTPTPPRVPVIP